MKALCICILLFQVSVMFAQPNCEAYKYSGDTLKYQACTKAMEAKGFYQFSKEYQTVFDRALAIDSTFDYAYWAKSIAYLKSGDFITWKKLIDKAVKYNPEGHLGYRGWCRYQFFNDYEGAINDIELLDSLVSYDIGYSQNGTYHLNVAKGLWYAALGENHKALGIIEKQVSQNELDDFIGQFDYLHLGVLYLKTGEFTQALEAFGQQEKVNPLAEAKYYSALTYLKINDIQGYKSSLEQALVLYTDDQIMTDTYSTPLDKIYLVDIQNELEKAKSMRFEKH